MIITEGYEINIESLLKQTNQQQLIFAYQHITDNMNDNILYNKSVKESIRKTIHIIPGKLEVKLNFKESSIEGYMTCFMTLNNTSDNNNAIDINDEMEISWECDGVKRTMSHPLYEYLIMTKSFGRRRLFPSTKSNEIILNMNIIRNPLLPAPNNKQRRPIDRKDVGTNNINSDFIVNYLDSEICTKGCIAIYNEFSGV